MGRLIPGYSPESAFSRDPGPRDAATSSTHRKVRPIIFHIKRDTTNPADRRNCAGFVRGRAHRPVSAAFQSGVTVPAGRVAKLA